MSITISNANTPAIIALVNVLWASLVARVSAGG